MNATEMSKLLDSNPDNRAISTWTGHAFDLFDKGTWEFTTEDIAHALSNICRFAGHIESRTVAQHSLQVAELLAPKGKRVQLLGLLHDASEAYLLDIPRPWKGEVQIGGRTYYEVEDEIQMAIFEWAGILDLYHGQAWEDVKHADYLSYQWEVERRGNATLPVELPNVVKRRFLNLWDELTEPLPPPTGLPKAWAATVVGHPRHAPGMEKVTCVSTPSRMWGTNGK